MGEKSIFCGMEFPTFYHPDCKEDEVFMQYVGEEEKKNLKTPWKTVRFGKKDDLGHPVFVKRQEIIDVGGILVPVREDLRRK